MALRAIMLKKNRDMKAKELERITSEMEKLEKRAVELEIAVNEVESDEEMKEVEIQIKAYNDEKDELEEEKGSLEEDIAKIDEEIAEEEEGQEPLKSDNSAKKKRTKEMNKLETRDINVLIEREDVQEFVYEIRSAITEKRAITNAGLTIPTAIMPLIRETIETESKLLPYVFYQRVSGTARQPIMGAIPEAIWTEMCANLNELNLVFNIVEMDGYKVGGYIPICNAVVEDNDIDLVTKVYEAIGASIAYALDKAILYGTGTKMPMGIATRLAQTTKPSDYPTNARTWENLRGNIITGTGATGTALIQEIILNSGKASSKYGRNAVWVMNHKTATAVKANTLMANSEGALVSGVADEMPVVGGTIIELNFIPDGDIFFGYFDNYALAERGEVRIEQSEHVQFVQDNLVVKGVGRFDGAPAIAEGFVLMSTGKTAPTTALDFAEDTANQVTSA